MESKSFEVKACEKQMRFQASGKILSFTTMILIVLMIAAATNGLAQTFDRTDYSAGYGPQGGAVGDFDGVNGPDIAIANLMGNNVSVFLNNGDGTFAPQVLYSVNLMPFAIVAADLNGNGFVDLATVNRDTDDISVLFNDGNGLFVRQPDYATDDQPYAICAADLDGIKGNDLITTSATNGTTSVLLNSGSGIFGSFTNYSGPGVLPVSVTADDVDGINGLDLITVYRSAEVSIFLNNGGGIFAHYNTYPVGLNPRCVATADLDGSGGSDIVTANTGGDNVSVLFSLGSGNFTPAANYAAGDDPNWVDCGDMNNDGDIDIITANGSSDDISLLLNNGNGTFRPPTSIPVGDFPRFVESADFNGDGDLDLVASNTYDGSISVLLQVPEGCFIPGDVDASGFVDLGDLEHYNDYFSTGIINCIPASDVNADGLTLTYADMIFLYRLLVVDGFGLPSECICLPGIPSCVFNCVDELTVCFPDNGGTWPAGTDQVVTWALLDLHPAIVTDIDVTLEPVAGGPSIPLFTGLSNTTVSMPIVAPFISVGYYYVKVTANLINGYTKYDLSSLPIYVPDIELPAIGIVNTGFRDYMYKEMVDINPPLNYTGNDKNMSSHSQRDIDMTVTPDGKYILTPRDYYSIGGPDSLERIDLTLPGLPVDVVLAPIIRLPGVDPVSIPFSDLMLYAVDDKYRMFDLSQPAALLSTTTGIVNVWADRLWDIDPTISFDGKKAIRPGYNGYDILNIENPSAVTITSIPIATGADLGIDVQITSDNGAAVYLSPSGYHVIDISDPDNATLVSSISGNPTKPPVGKNFDIDIALRNCGDRFIYPAILPTGPGYDLVDITNRYSPQIMQIDGNPNIRTAIDPTLTGSGKYALYPADQFGLRGYDRINMVTGDVDFIPGNPLAFDGFDIVITPNDSFAVYQAYRITPLGPYTFMVEEGYDIIDIENAVLANFVIGQPGYRAHIDIQITPDGTRALYQHGIPVTGYDLIIDLNNPSLASVIFIPLQDMTMSPRLDTDPVISPDGKFAIHGGNFYAPFVGVGYVCISLEPPYLARPPVTSKINKTTWADPIINYAATTAEDVDQDCYRGVNEVIYPEPDFEDDDYYTYLIEYYGDDPDLDPTWEIYPGPKRATQVPEMHFAFKNGYANETAFTFKAYFTNQQDEFAIWYQEPESFTTILGPEDSVTISCKPPVPDSLPLGLNHLIVEWYDGETTGTPNNRLSVGFVMVRCGDANGDETINVGDAVHLINYVFKGGAAAKPLEAGDVNCDDAVNVGDAVYMINYVFKSGPAPCVCP